MPETFTIDDETLSVRTEQYATGGTAVRLWVVEDGRAIEPYATVSVNVPGTPLSPGEFIFKTYSENRGLLQKLLSVGVVETTGKTVEVGDAGPQPVCKLR